MSDEASKNKAVKTGPRYGQFWHAAAATMLAAMAFQAANGLKPGEKGWQGVAVFLTIIIGFPLYVMPSVCLQTVSLALAYRSLKFFKKDFAVSNSSGVWAVSGLLYNAAFALVLMPWVMNLGTLDALFSFATGSVIAGPLVLFAHIFCPKLARQASKLGTKLAKPARNLCPNLFKLFGK